MTNKSLAIAWISLVAFAIPIGGTAHADTAAGWDFSQYRGTGLLSVDGATVGNALDANYSSFDPTFNVGAESAAFGTLHFDGQFGSSAAPAGAFLPISGSLESNLDGPVQGFGVNPFDSRTILASEGQPFQQLLSMTAAQAVNVVFAADLSSAGEAGDNWAISFGGKTFPELRCAPNCASTVTVEFSTDGNAYADFGSVQLDQQDKRYRVALDPAESDRAFVRLGLDPTAGQPIIDNVVIAVPEPGVTAALLASTAALVAMRRRRA